VREKFVDSIPGSPPAARASASTRPMKAQIAALGARCQKLSRHSRRLPFVWLKPKEKHAIGCLATQLDSAVQRLTDPGAKGVTGGALFFLDRTK